MTASLNNFGDHAPKPEWIKNFFAADNFIADNTLGVRQIAYFQYFLFNAQLLDRKKKH